MKRKTEDCSFRTSIGGQALIEGILMRGPKKQAIVCRTRDGIVEKVEDLKLVRDRYPILGLPFLRGIVTLFDSLFKGMRALTYSASLVPLEEQGEPDKLDQWIEAHFEGGLIPGLKTHFFARNLSEGAVRIAILLLYMRLVCEVSDVKRLFSYHGAEHKTIFCYEHGKPLTVENVRVESRFHPRCGTSFLLVVIVISILVNSVVRLSNSFARMGAHLLLLPVVIGLSYELNRWCGRHDNWLSAILSAPGKWLQHMTTNEPDDSMIECAIRAMELVIPEEKGSDAW